MPLVSIQTIEKLILAFQKEPERRVAPSWKGKRGNPVITSAILVYGLIGFLLLRAIQGPENI